MKTPNTNLQTPNKHQTSNSARSLLRRLGFGSCLVFGVWLLVFRAAAADADLKDLSLDGGRARFVIEANIGALRPSDTNAIFATALQHHIQASFEKLTHSIRVDVDVIQGDPKEIALVLTGDGDVRQVTGEGLLDWSMRQESGGKRFLVLRPKPNRGASNLVVNVTAETELKELPLTIVPLAISSSQPALSRGYVRVDSDPAISARAINTTNVIGLELRFLPKEMRVASTNDVEPLAFRFEGASYSLPLRVTTADPEARRVMLLNSQLTGVVKEDTAEFTFIATARVRNPKGDSIELLSGSAALTEFQKGTNWRIRVENGRYIAVFDEPGDYPIRLKFNAAVRHADTWSNLDFRVAPSALQSLALQGLPTDTQFRISGGARPERNGANFVTFLPADGAVQLAWKTSRAESEGKLFYSAEMLSQISVAPGLMRQFALLDGKVMQGELTRLTLTLAGEGQVTRVLGDQVLAWNVEPITNSRDRRLVVQFNQPQRDQFAIQIQMQTPLSAFPQAFDAMRVTPDGATRFAGYLRVVNEGAVRLEVVNATGLSQVSPEQFPESDLTRALLRTDAKQRFIYRFSGASYALRVQADNVLPEISVSSVAAYHLSETELAIDTEIELDIREAPIRELALTIPKGYAIAKLAAAGMNDYFVTEGETNAQLRIVYGQPIIGRQIVQLRLERNGALGAAEWMLPRIDVAKAKSVRGHVAVSADAGFRITPGTTQGLTEIATAFFPRKLAGIQVALRMSDANWSATMRVERLPQSIQADAFHLFSIGERIAYGSSVLNFQISGAPVSMFRLELSNEYFNVEFLGKDVRLAKKTDAGYEVYLHTPVAGAYTLLVTYERPFKGQGETLAFTGARPLDAQTEQGHTIIVSAYQFQVKPANVSTGLLPLEPAEVPAEYRLFFDAPILAAYRYTSRPFNLQLVLSPLAQGDTLNLVADRAALTTRISKQGQVVTDARYFVKNRGQPHFRLVLPDGNDLWSATVNGATVVPTLDGKAHLIPLPQSADPNAIATVDLKLASRSANATRVNVAAPVIGAPVLLAEWKVLADAGQRLIYRKGSLAPAQGIFDNSGFAELFQLFRNVDALAQLGVGLALLIAGLIVWRWSSRAGVYRFSAQHVVGTALGVVAILFCIVAFVKLASMGQSVHHNTAQGLTFVAPIQPENNALSLEVDNIEDKPSVWRGALQAWPAVLAVAAFVFAWITTDGALKTLARVVGWTLLFWAALRWPNGVPAFFAVLVAMLLLHVVIPAIRRLWQLPPKPKTTPPPDAAAPAVALIIGSLLLVAMNTDAATTRPVRREFPPVAESVTQQVRVEEKFGFATAKIHWVAKKGEFMPFLWEPAVLTRISYPTNALRLIDAHALNKRSYDLFAVEAGTYDIEFDYQIQPATKDGESGFVLPTARGLVNELTLRLVNLDVDVTSPNAVSVERTVDAATNTVAKLVLSPSTNTVVNWKPRSRDTKREKAVFYAEISQLYVPAAGVIEGQHHVQIRPAQGELTEVIFNVPSGATITDVFDAAQTNRTATSLVSLWRFDPDTRQLRVTLKPAQAKPFAIIVRSQIAVGPLPIEQRIGLLSVTNAAGQIGLLGIATGSDVQLDNVTVATNSLTAINLEDFPASLVQRFATQFPGITLRRAWRYSEPNASALVSASAVEPDVRIESQQTLSLGEDRTVLAATLNAEITRAGIFRLSFVLPSGLDVESISGPALSHWTELKNGDERVITMHLTGKTEGRAQFSVTLAGQGVKPTANWNVPRLLLREASKQRGQLVIVPEQGLRLQVASRDGLTQLDPQRAGIRQKGVLAFRLLQDQWSLALDMEQVDAWVQVESLQNVVVGEAQIKATANLQYKIENTGLKALRVWLPTNAESVQFRGDQVADFVKRAGAETNGLLEWEVKLHRKVIGNYLLQVTFQQITSEQSRELVLRGIEASGVNLQRGFVTVESAGRLQIETGTPPASLQPSEWQTVPKTLRQDLQAAAANFTFRLVEPAFVLPIKVQRHEAAKLLPARVNHITLKSVVSDDGMMLTHVRLDMVPGDKRLLNLTLPAKARFWFAFVNQNGVAPWLEADKILIPLEQQSKPDQAIAVELFYSSPAGNARSRELDLKLLGPKFDLPLEDITWQVFLNDKWNVKHWDGTLQLLEAHETSYGGSINLGSYLQSEALIRSEKTKVAEQQLQLGNTLLANGAPDEARRAFQNAFGLSQHDNAFNEDARVQLHNLKMQQALVGLNVRQNGAVSTEQNAVANKVRDLRQRRNAAYTQDEAKQLFDQTPADDNAALMRLAERMVKQQDAALPAPAAIRAAIPEQGRVLTFKRAVQVDKWADMRVEVEAKVARTASLGGRFALLVGLAALAAVAMFLGRRRSAATL